MTEFLSNCDIQNEVTRMFKEFETNRLTYDESLISLCGKCNYTENIKNVIISNHYLHICKCNKIMIFKQSLMLTPLETLKLESDELIKCLNSMEREIDRLRHSIKSGIFSIFYYYLQNCKIKYKIEDLYINSITINTKLLINCIEFNTLVLCNRLE